MLCQSKQKKTFDFAIYLNRHSFATQIMRDQMWKKHAFISSFKFCIGLPSGSLLLFFQPEMGKNWNQIWLPYNLPKISLQIKYLLNVVYSMVLCTLYTNLGLDAVEYGVGLTEAKVVVTSQELLPKLAKIIDRCPTVTHVVAFEEPWRGDLPHSIRWILETTWT